MNAEQILRMLRRRGLRDVTRVARAQGVKIKKLPGNWELKSPFAEEAVPAFRSLDGLKGSDAFIAGTNKNEIYLLREGGEATVSSPALMHTLTLPLTLTHIRLRRHPYAGVCSPTRMEAAWPAAMPRRGNRRSWVQNTHPYGGRKAWWRQIQRNMLNAAFFS